MGAFSHPETQHLLVVGAPKSATTSLFNHLSAHPQICAANRKETYFFAREFDYNQVCTLPLNYQNFQSYFLHRTDSCKIHLEATPYTMYSKDAVKNIRETLPNPRLLLIIRDPIDRLFSDFHFHKQREHPAARGTFEEFLDYQRKTRLAVPNLIELGCYFRFLDPFLQGFEQDQIIILFFEEFKADINGQLQNLSRILRINEDHFQNLQPAIHNMTLKVRYSWANRFYMHMEPVVADIRKMLIHHPHVYKIFQQILMRGKKAYNSFNNDKSRANEPIDPKIYDQLRDYYHPHTQKLAAILKRDLPWNSYH